MSTTPEAAPLSPSSLVAASCELWIDGVRVDDDRPDYDAGQTVALSPLSISWGREQPGDHPDTGTATWTLTAPQQAAQDVLSTVHVGSAVDVWAAADLPDNVAPGFVQTADDPTLQTWPLGDANERYGSRRVHAGSGLDSLAEDPGAVVVVHNGARVLALRLRTAIFDQFSVELPPRVFSPASTLPDAWDDIPQQQQAEETWRFTVTVDAPPGVRIALAYTVGDNPYVSNGAFSSTLTQLDAADGTVQTLTRTRTLNAPPVSLPMPTWVRMRVGVSNLRHRWSQQTTSWAATGGSWARAGVVRIHSYSIEREAREDTTRRVPVHSGQVTDLTWAAADDTHVALSGTSGDLTTWLGNRIVGTVPWPAETVAQRVARIVALLDPAPTVIVDAAISGTVVARRDVDSQPALDLLRDVATSAGATLWPATHDVTGPFLWLESLESRESTRTLTMGPGGLVAVDVGGEEVGTLSACDVTREPVTWAQNVGDVVTAVTVAYLTQPAGSPPPDLAEQKVTVLDAAAVPTFGVRRLTVETELTTLAAAQSLATRLLAYARAVSWHVSGLSVDTLDLAPELPGLSLRQRLLTLMQLLDGTTRIGLGLMLTDLPVYSPAGAEVEATYVEGGTYTYDQGAWLLSLNLSPGATQGHTATWAELAPTGWGWSDLSAVGWDDTYGASAP